MTISFHCVFQRLSIACQRPLIFTRTWVDSPLPPSITKRLQNCMKATLQIWIVLCSTTKNPPITSGYVIRCYIERCVQIVRDRSFGRSLSATLREECAINMCLISPLGRRKQLFSQQMFVESGSTCSTAGKLCKSHSNLRTGKLKIFYSRQIFTFRSLNL